MTSVKEVSAAGNVLSEGNVISDLAQQGPCSVRPLLHQFEQLRSSCQWLSGPWRNTYWRSHSALPRQPHRPDESHVLAVDSGAAVALGM